ncbi:MAG: phosphatase PAP2 family protein [Acidobacteria bacterium]|nr:phosphatase PAP2 family protein [Acidobacteriota bacterium]
MLLLCALTASLLCALSIVAIDGPLATALSSVSPDTRRAIQQGVGVIEVLFGFRVSSYLYGGLLIMAGLATFLMKRGSLAWALLFVGFSHVTARFAAGILKPPFSRLRPFEAVGGDGWHDVWFASAGNSFPSGHAVHFWSLFFPLAILFPRHRIALVVLPVLISAARVVVNDHYLSDVLASAALAAVLTSVFARTLLDRGERGALQLRRR